MLKQYDTVDEIKAEVTKEDEEKYLKLLQENDEIPDFLKSTQKIKDLYISANWLGNKLEAAGCPEKEREDICFAHGQRSAFGNAWASAGRAWNAWVQGRPEYGGPELAAEITKVVKS